MSNLLTINGGGQSLLLRRRALLMNQGFEVEWNQLVQRPVGTFNIDRTSGGSAYAGVGVSFPICNPNHFFCFNFIIEFTSEDTFRNYYTNYGFYPIVEGKQILKKTGSATSVDKEIRFTGIPATMHITGTSSLKNMFDLTAMFGIGNEPPTVQQFEAWLIENNINPNEYIPYNAGEKRKMTKPSWL